jgi:hypothetical protein
VHPLITFRRLPEPIGVEQYRPNGIGRSLALTFGNEPYGEVDESQRITPTRLQ